MPWDLLIRNAHIVTPAGVSQQDLPVEDGRIPDRAPTLHGAAKAELDASGLHLFPGLIDPHVHFNEPGRTAWEGLATGSAALAAGGGTLFFDMPLNSAPPVLDAASFDAKTDLARAKSHTDFALWGGLTPRNLDKLEELADRGVVGFKAFMCNSGIEDFPRADDDTLLRGMHIAAKLKLPVAVHAENEEITLHRTASAIALGRTTWRDYLESRPVIAEYEAIRRAMTFAADAGCALHVVHVSDP